MVRAYVDHGFRDLPGKQLRDASCSWNSSSYANRSTASSEAKEEFREESGIGWGLEGLPMVAVRMLLSNRLMHAKIQFKLLGLEACLQ